MTVCIAATCDADTNDGAKIIVCVDALASSDLGSVDSYHKDRALPRGCRCLTAGSPEDANALLPLLTQQFRTPEVIDETNVCGLVRNALAARKQQKADEFTIGKWGLRYPDFLGSKNKFPDDVFARGFEEIERLPWPSDLLVVGFLSDGFPIIVRVYGSAVDIVERFAVVGSGSLLAEASLLHRDQMRGDSLNETLYRLYEAKRQAQRVRTVGEYTHLAIFQANKYPVIVGGPALKYLEQKFEACGPQEVGHIEIPPNSFTTIGEAIIVSPSDAPARVSEPAAGGSS